MSRYRLRQQDVGGARVLVVSLPFAPCREVGGKRFSFLSRFLSERCVEYHVLARYERQSLADETAFQGNVHRVRIWPDYPPRHRAGVRYKIARAWELWLCLIDPYLGWVVPATWHGLRLSRKHGLNVIIVTVPPFSPIVAALLISRLSGAELVIDYRDPMTSIPRAWPAPIGKCLSRAVELSAIRRASAVVVCSDIMRKEFEREFGEQAPGKLAVIYNGFLEFENEPQRSQVAGRIDMVYAGEFYGTRRLAVIAPTLRAMMDAGEIGPETFRFHVYSELRPDDHELIYTLGIAPLIEQHTQLPYAQIRKVMQRADILFLPSGDDVPYAVPFKFFDYLSVRRPVLAVAPEQSAVAALMHTVDCGEFAAFGDEQGIRSALLRLLQREKMYTFDGAERFKWERAAEAYMRVIDDVVARRMARS